MTAEQNLLRTLIDNLPDYIYVKDRASRFIIGNAAVARLMAADTPEALINKTDFDFYPQDLAQQYFNDEQMVIQTGQPLINREEPVVNATGEQTWILTTKVPLKDEHGQIIGVIGIGRDITQRRQAEEENARLLQAVESQSKQLRALTGQLAETQEAERTQLSRELHDRVGQSLTALSLNLNIIRGQILDTFENAEAIQMRLDDSLILVERTTERIRDVMANLRPPVLDDYGLVSALEWYSRHFAARSNFHIIVQGEEPVPRLSKAVENALFRIAQEALTNAAKHAQAKRVTMTLTSEENAVQLGIEDDGVGFETTSLLQSPGRPGWGLLTMTERAEAVGGQCHIDSKPGSGTRITVRVARRH